MAQKKDEVTGKWMYYGSYVDSNKKRIQYKKRGFDSRKLARKAEDHFRDCVDNPIAHMTFEELYKKYLPYAKKSIKDSTDISNKEMSTKICATLGSYLLQELTEEKLENYINDLDTKYSKEYVKKIYYNLNKVLRFGVEKKYLNHNPLINVKRDARKNELKKEMKFWEPSDFQKFITNVDDELYKTLFTFMYYMGSRKGETIALTWSDVDFIKGTVRINRAASSKLRNRITSPKTGNSIRTISMPNQLIDIMKNWYKSQKNLYEYSEDCFLFGYHKPLPVETIRRKFKNYIDLTNELIEDEKDKIPVIRMHDLRHSHASFLINNMSAGFTDFDIAKRLGDTVSTLHSTYAHWFKSADKGIMDFMNKSTKNSLPLN